MWTILLIVTGCSLRDKSGGNNAGSDELAPVSSVAMGDEEANTLKDKTPIQLYLLASREISFHPRPGISAILK